MRQFTYLLSCLTITALSALGAHAQTAPEKKTLPGAIFDCADVTIDYTDDPSLTRDEKLQRMDEALYRSLSKYDSCQEARTASTNPTDPALQVPQSPGATTQGGASVAATDISGMEITDKSEEQSPGSESLTSPSRASMAEKNMEEGGAQTAASDNGKLPEDIPPADNDSVLEAQIRQAAINETDPEIKKRLWNEYRKYKGLPARE